MHTDLLLYSYVVSAFLVFQTYDAKHRLSNHFYVSLDRLLSWIRSDSNDTFIENDINNIIIVRRCSAKKLHITVNWLHEMGDELHGYYQNFDMTVDQVMALTENDSRNTACTLIHRYEENRKSKIILTESANELYRKLTTRQKHAFVRCISRGFYWGNSTVEIHADWNADFWFREYNADGSVGVTGGICCSNVTVMAHDAIRYEVHT